MATFLRDFPGKEPRIVYEAWKNHAKSLNRALARILAPSLIRPRRHDYFFSQTGFPIYRIEKASIRLNHAAEVQLCGYRFQKMIDCKT